MRSKAAARSSCQGDMPCKLLILKPIQRMRMCSLAAKESCSLRYTYAVPTLLTQKCHVQRWLQGKQQQPGSWRWRALQRRGGSGPRPNLAAW